MITGFFTHAEVAHLHRLCAHSHLRAKLASLLAGDLIPCDDYPKTVVLHLTGDVLTCCGVEYYDAAAADDAFERIWKRLQGDPDGDPKRNARRPRAPRHGAGATGAHRVVRPKNRRRQSGTRRPHGQS